MAKTTTLAVEGMHCEKCAGFVTEALQKVPGVERATVDLAAKQATVEGEASGDALIHAVEEEGYSARLLDA